ncbi:hypothetical protein, partial [Pseudomonas syringae group genomosp. 7]|uniref:hypothetical protein n=1 Tax=Pseudomonas syringae group genomosp. 7 TaxID=251699 RepID=UPI00376FDC48
GNDNAHQGEALGQRVTGQCIRVQPVCCDPWAGDMDQQPAEHRQTQKYQLELAQQASKALFVLGSALLMLHRAHFSVRQCGIL